MTSGVDAAYTDVPQKQNNIAMISFFIIPSPSKNGEKSKPQPRSFIQTALRSLQTSSGERGQISLWASSCS